MNQKIDRSTQKVRFNLKVTSTFDVSSLNWNSVTYWEATFIHLIILLYKSRVSFNSFSNENCLIVQNKIARCFYRKNTHMLSGSCVESGVSSCCTLRLESVWPWPSFVWDLLSCLIKLRWNWIPYLMRFYSFTISLFGFKLYRYIFTITEFPL